MWEVGRHEWRGFTAYRDASRVPGLLTTIAVSDDDDVWNAALSYLEQCSCDLGVPAEIAPAVVECLMAIAVRAPGRKRRAILSLLEELTCGRGAEHYTSDQRRWRADAVMEVALGFGLLVDVLETTIEPEEAEDCLELLVYCAEEVPSLRGRVRHYLEMCERRFPALQQEVRALGSYIPA